MAMPCFLAGEGLASVLQIFSGDVSASTGMSVSACRLAMKPAWYSGEAEDTICTIEGAASLRCLPNRTVTSETPDASSRISPIKLPRICEVSFMSSPAACVLLRINGIRRVYEDSF